MRGPAQKADFLETGPEDVGHCRVGTSSCHIFVRHGPSEEDGNRQWLLSDPQAKFKRFKWPVYASQKKHLNQGSVLREASLTQKYCCKPCRPGHSASDHLYEEVLTDGASYDFGRGDLGLKGSTLCISALGPPV